MIVKCKRLQSHECNSQVELNSQGKEEDKKVLIMMNREA